MTQSERDRLLMRVDIGLNGNGGKGLNGRVDELEEWAKKRPQECPAKPLERGTIIRQRALEVSVIGLILVAAQLVGKVFGLW